MSQSQCEKKSIQQCIMFSDFSLLTKISLLLNKKVLLHYFRFLRKPNILESVTFDREMFETKSRCLHCQCGNFSQKIFCKLVQDIFLLVVKDPLNNNVETCKP